MRRFRALIAGLTIAIGLSATVPAAAENVLRWASTTGALTIDPHAYDETPTWAQLRQVYEPLIGFNSNLDLVPGLAVAWRLVEPTVWEFELRPNVRFHDGTLLTAADVVFSFARTRTELPISPGTQIESIAAVRAIDEHTVRIETRFPDPGLQEKVRRTYIMSESWAAAHDAQVPVNLGVGEENYASRHANGTGPFILKEFEPNGPVVMVRNPDWWGFERYPHNIDRIEYMPITDPKERLWRVVGRLAEPSSAPAWPPCSPAVPGLRARSAGGRGAGFNRPRRHRCNRAARTGPNYSSGCALVALLDRPTAEHLSA